MDKEQNKKANILCFISLGCMFGLPTLLVLIDRIILHFDLQNELIVTCFSALSALSVLAAYVLMIIVRVKYRKSRFGFALMIIYIVLTALSVLVTVLLFILCSASIEACSSCIGSLGT